MRVRGTPNVEIVPMALVFVGVGVIGGLMLATAVLGLPWPSELTKLSGWIGNAGILTTLTIGAGLVGLFLNNRASNKTLHHAQLAEIATRFQRGVELLSSDGVASRMGGVHILRDVASTAPETYHFPVIDTLSGFLTTSTRAQYDAFYRWELALRAKEEPDDNDAKIAFRNSESDVVLAFRTIGELRSRPENRATERHAGHTRIIRIERVALCTVDIEYGDFSGVQFLGCIFAVCKFSGCDLSSITFKGRLPYTNEFLDCDFRAADFERFTGDWKIEGSVKFTLCDIRGARIIPHMPKFSIAECLIDGKSDFGYAVPVFSRCWTDRDQPQIKATFTYVPPIEVAAKNGRYDDPTPRGFRRYVVNQTLV